MTEMTIDARDLDFAALGRQIRSSDSKQLALVNVRGHRYIGAGLSGKVIDIFGVPGNALGAYMEGAKLRVHGNAQDAVGDTMNEGEITVHGSCGDALGYAMRGGCIFVRGSVGYRCGIHMKAYEQKQPLIVIGGSAGSFLGEYQAGGRIVVLGLDGDGETPPVGDFLGTGQHGGEIFLRCKRAPEALPSQVTAAPATEEDMERVAPDIRAFCQRFGLDAETLLRDSYYCVRPNTQNPYKRLYTVY